MKRDFDLMTEQRREAIDTLTAQTSEQILADLLAPPTLEGLTDMLEIYNVQARLRDRKAAADRLSEMLLDDAMLRMMRSALSLPAEDFQALFRQAIGEAVGDAALDMATVAVEKTEYESQYE